MSENRNIKKKIGFKTPQLIFSLLIVGGLCLNSSLPIMADEDNVSDVVDTKQDNDLPENYKNTTLTVQNNQAFIRFGGLHNKNDELSKIQSVELLAKKDNISRTFRFNGDNTIHRNTSLYDWLLDGTYKFKIKVKDSSLKERYGSDDLYLSTSDQILRNSGISNAPLVKTKSFEEEAKPKDQAETMSETESEEKQENQSLGTHGSQPEISQPTESEAVKSFKAKYSDLFTKNINNIKLSDKAQLEKAFEDHNNLKDEEQKLVYIEPLTHLYAKVLQLEEEAKSKQNQAENPEKKEDSGVEKQEGNNPKPQPEASQPSAPEVQPQTPPESSAPAPTPENNINPGLSESPEKKENEDTTKPDTLTPETAKTNEEKIKEFKKLHETVLALDFNTVQAKHKEQIQNAIEDLKTHYKFSELFNEEIKLKELYSKAQELEDEERYKQESIVYYNKHQNILNKKETDITLSDKEAINQAKQDFEKLPIGVQNVIPDLKERIESFEAKIKSLEKKVDNTNSTKQTPTLVSTTQLDIVIDNNQTLVVKTSADINTFKEVRVDSQVLDPKHYDLTSGSTIVSIKPSYLNTLAEGTHKLEIVSNESNTYKAHTVTVLFTIQKPKQTVTHNPNWQQDLRKHNEFINKTQPKTSLPNTGYVSNHSILLASTLLTLVAYKLYKKED